VSWGSCEGAQADEDLVVAYVGVLVLQAEREVGARVRSFFRAVTTAGLTKVFAARTFFRRVLVRSEHPRPHTVSMPMAHWRVALPLSPAREVVTTWLCEALRSVGDDAALYSRLAKRKTTGSCSDVLLCSTWS